MGEATGDATGDASGLAVATGAGVTVGLFGTLVFGSQAPNTATLAAKIVDNISDLLIVFSFYAPAIMAGSLKTHGLGPSAGRHPQPE